MPQKIDSITPTLLRAADQFFAAWGLSGCPKERGGLDFSAKQA